MGFIVNSVSFAVAVLCFIAIRMIRKRERNIPWLIVPILALLGGACLAATVVGSFLSTAIGGVIGSLLVGVASVLLILAIVLDLKDKHCDKVALIGLIVLPVLFQAGTGPLAEVGNQMSGGVQGIAENSIGTLIGG